MKIDYNHPDMKQPPPCKKCGHQKEFKGEPDGCLGWLPGVVDACCGHGENGEQYLHFQDGTVITDFSIGKKMEPCSVPLWIVNDAKIDHGDETK